jgi:tellurite resistance protein TehA-like permease
MEVGASRVVPGHFAVVMATGILSVDATLVGQELLSLALLAIAGAIYLGLVVLMAVRLVCHPGRLVALPEPATGFEALAFVAGTGVLGSRLVLADWPIVPFVLWLLTVASWGLLTSRLAATLTVLPWQRIAPTLRGSWLMVVVATQAMVVLGTHAGNGKAAPTVTVTFICTCGWLLGLSLYVGIIVLLLARLLARPLEVGAVTPDYWICMGALAISTLAGSQLLTISGEGPLPLVRSFVAGATIGAWTVGTAWIPWLVGIELWRQRTDPSSHRYERGRWSTVFPLGMYGACSLQLAPLLHEPGLSFLGHAFFWLGLGCWITVGAGAAGAVFKTLRPSG